VEKEEDEGKEDKKKQGEVTRPKYPVEGTKTSKKRKISPKKPIAWKKSKANKPPFKW
jgi:hypothetical protein